MNNLCDVRQCEQSPRRPAEPGLIPTGNLISSNGNIHERMSHKRQVTVRITRNRYKTKSYTDQDFGKFNQDRLFFLSCSKAHWDKKMRLISTYITSNNIIIIIIIIIIMAEQTSGCPE